MGNTDTAFRVRSSYERVFEPGQTVLAEGQKGDHLYVIQSGEIEITREGAEGHRVVARLGPGDFFGELALVEGHASTTRAVSVALTHPSMTISAFAGNGNPVCLPVTHATGWPR